MLLPHLSRNGKIKHQMSKWHMDLEEIKLLNRPNCKDPVTNLHEPYEIMKIYSTKIHWPECLLKRQMLSSSVDIAQKIDDK